MTSDNKRTASVSPDKPETIIAALQGMVSDRLTIQPDSTFRGRDGIIRSGRELAEWDAIADLIVIRLLRAGIPERLAGITDKPTDGWDDPNEVITDWILSRARRNNLQHDLQLITNEMVEIADRVAGRLMGISTAITLGIAGSER